MSTGEAFLVFVGAMLLVMVLVLFSAVVAIFGLNGLFQVTGLEYQIPYTVKSIFYMWLVLMSFGRSGSSTSKK